MKAAETLQYNVSYSRRAASRRHEGENRNQAGSRVMTHRSRTNRTSRSWGKLALLGATALSATGALGAGVAEAEDQPIEVSIGGDYQAAMGIIDQDSDDGELADDTNSIAFGQDLE
ncbi:MAG: hypothetical protein AB7G46_15385, partial [Alphaproteobacteria bacterium]